MIDVETNWGGKRVAVLGFGVEGQSSARYFSAQGAEVVVHDEGLLADKAVGPYRFCLGEAAFVGLDDFDAVVRSPGIRPDHAGLAEVEPHKLTSQTELFLQRWRDNCVGITGTKGKGTTSTLVAHCLNVAGKKCLLGGNIGVPLLDLMAEMDNQTVAVLELSSFQLMDITVSPAVAVVLMIVPEHLNYHMSVEEYVAAKARLVAFQRPDDLAIVTVGYSLNKQLLSQVVAEQWSIGVSEDCRAVIAPGEVRFGRSEAECLKLSQTPLLGQHNVENLAAAGLVARHFGLTVKVIKTAMETFVPLPHRLQVVTEVGGIRYVNDSFATTPEATLAAVNSFSEPLALILGGSDKGSDFVPLIQLLRQRANVSGVVTIGQIGESLLEMCRAAEVVAVEGGEDMTTIIRQAEDLLPGKKGIVLLSPGAASFGMFKDYKDRGEQFVAAVQER